MSNGAAVYDAYGFRLDSEIRPVCNETSSVPEVVERNRTHKWERVLEHFSLMPKERVRALLEEGVPDAIRARVWAALIDGSKKESYRKYLLMPDNKAVEQIKLDLHRTLTSHRMFEEKMGEGQQKLLRLLKAYSYHNPTVGYCQGMSFLAAILLTVLPEDDAFAGLCQVIAGMEGYFVPTMWELLEDSKIFKLILEAEMVDVNNHLQQQGILPLMFMCKHFMTMFSQLPWPTVLRVVDFYLYEGKTALFRFGFGLLSILHDELLELASIDKLLPFLLEPASRKLSHHILVPHLLQIPIERHLRNAILKYRDEQNPLLQSACAGTPLKRPASAPAVNTSAVGGGGTNTNTSFFHRFLDTVASPIRSNIKRKVDPVSGRVVATPPAAKRAFALSPLSPGSARVNGRASSVRGGDGAATPEGAKKRGRLLSEFDDEENLQSPFGSSKKLGLMSPGADAEEMAPLLTPHKVNYMHYRASTLGRTFEDSLDELLSRKAITAEQKEAALLQFDIHVNGRLGHMQQNPQQAVWLGLEGDVDEYSNAENVWSWTLKNTAISFARDEAGLKNAESMSGGTVQVIANDAFPGRIVQRGKTAKKKLKTVAEPKPKKEPKEKKEPKPKERKGKRGGKNAEPE